MFHFRQWATNSEQCWWVSECWALITLTQSLNTYVFTVSQALCSAYYGLINLNYFGLYKLRSIVMNRTCILLPIVTSTNRLNWILPLQAMRIISVQCFQSHLALYCFANNQVSSALRLMYRTRYLALLCHGESHPEIGLIDVSLQLWFYCLFVISMCQVLHKC